MDIGRDCRRSERVRELAEVIDWENRTRDERMYDTERAVRLEGFGDDDYPTRAVDVDTGEVMWTRGQVCPPGWASVRMARRARDLGVEG